MERQPSHETPQDNFDGIFNYTDQLLVNYGFTESLEMQSIREQILGNSEEDNTSLISEYQELAEHQINTLEGPEYTRVQINLIIASATLKRDSGNMKGFLKGIDDARDYAYQVYDDELDASLAGAPSREIARVVYEAIEGIAIDKDIVNEIAAEPYFDALNLAFDTLTSHELEARQTLKAFMDDIDEKYPPSE